MNTLRDSLIKFYDSSVSEFPDRSLTLLVTASTDEEKVGLAPKFQPKSKLKDFRNIVLLNDGILE